MPKILLSLRPPLVAACGGVLAVSACAEVPASAPAVAWRLQVHTVAEWPQPAALAERVARVSGVAVRPDVSTFAPLGYALTLQCADAAQCARAVDRLAASDLVTAVQPDDVRQFPSRPSRTTAP